MRLLLKVLYIKINKSQVTYNDQQAWIAHIHSTTYLHHVSTKGVLVLLFE